MSAFRRQGVEMPRGRPSGRPRIRSTHPEIWTSSDFLELSLVGRELFRYVKDMCDDSGIIKTSAEGLRKTACANVIVAVEECEEQLAIMESRYMIARYQFGVDSYVWVVNFRRYTYAERMSVSILPLPPLGVVKKVVRHLQVHEKLLELFAEWNYSVNNADFSELQQSNSVQDRDRDRDVVTTSHASLETQGEAVTPRDMSGEPDLAPPTTSEAPVAPGVDGQVRGAQERYAEGYRSFVSELNDACQREFRGIDKKGRNAYVARRKEGFSHEKILAAARGAAIDPYRIKNPQYRTPHSVLNSTIFQSLIDWGNGSLPATTHRNGTGIEDRIQERDEYAEALRAAAAKLRSGASVQ